MSTSGRVALAAWVPLAGCTIPPPPGDPPLRYRDARFSSVGVTPDLRRPGAVSISGGTPTNDYITTDDSPAIFFHGTEDPVAFYEWAVSNAAAMYTQGIFVVLEPFEGAGHGLVQAGYGDVIHEQTNYFLYAALDLAQADGVSAAAAREFALYERSIRRGYEQAAPASPR